MTMKTYDQETKLYKALMHPARLAILDLLREGEACVCHMEATFGFRQSYISQQLMALREAGLVDDRRDGLNIFYRVIRPEVFGVLDAMRQVTGVQSLAARPAPNTCNCPHCSFELASQGQLLKI
ncbi:MAG: metalloregulator ArsR/SmtB family transcription factor [Chloroflexota bacterium]